MIKNIIIAILLFYSVSAYFHVQTIKQQCDKTKSGKQRKVIYVKPEIKEEKVIVEVKPKQEPKNIQKNEEKETIRRQMLFFDINDFSD